ncbi:MAG: phage head-tail connector protein [Ignavibacteria bacterium]|nr:phage head-tail connector protein [Ignavibacteria bacterium]
MITLTTLKNYLNITDNSKDTFLQLCIDSSVKEIEDYLNRTITLDDYTEYINGNNRNLIYLRNYPIIEITSVKYFNEYDAFEDIFSTGDTPANSVLILSQTNSIKLLKGYFFFYGCKNIEIIYQAGFDSNTVPEDIKMVILELASTRFYNSALSGHSRLGKSSDNINSATGESTTFKDVEWKTILSKYKLLNP